MEEQHILDMLASDNPDDIREGAYEAGNTGLVSALPLLLEKLTIPNPGVQEAVDHALRKIDGPSVIKAAMPFLRSEDAPVRNLVMDVLREVGRSDVNLLGVLMHDADQDIRIFGADILGATGSALAVSLLSHALLYDTDVNVRYQAAVSLGVLASPESVHALNQAMNDDEWVRFAAIEAMIKVRAEASVGALLKALNNSSELVSANIVDALGEMGYIKAVPMLIKRLAWCSGPLANKIVRAIIHLVGANSLTLLDNSEYELLVKHMCAALDDEDVAIQDASINGLTASGAVEAFTAVFKLLSRLEPDRDHERMLSIVQSLARMGYNDFLEEILASGEDTEKQLAVDILSYVHDRRAQEALKANYWQQTRDVRRASLYVLASSGDMKDVDFFVEVLAKEKDQTSLKNVLNFLGRSGDAALIDAKVWPFLRHAYPDVQDAALEALMSVRDAGIRAKFIKMTQSGDILERQIAYYALRSYNEELDIVPNIALGLHDESPQVRRVAVESLGNFGRDLTMERLNYLAPCLNDDDKDVRLAVIDVFGMCQDDVGEKYLACGLRDHDPWIRARCVESLGKKRDPAMLSEIAAMLEDEHQLVVIKAIEALAALGKMSFKYVLPLLGHAEPEVQRAAEEGIEKIRRQPAGD